MESENRLINLSKKTVIQVTALLMAFMIVSIVLTYVIPGGEFGTLSDGSPDYSVYVRRADLPGVPLLKGLLAPILVFFSSDGLTLLVLSIFLIVVTGAFQIMSDVGGVRTLIGSLSRRFSGHRIILILAVSFTFYSMGAFLGQFENMLTMLPIVASLCVMLGYDSYTGFLCCIVSTGFGFATAITNPFTVILASEIIDVNPMINIWYRIVIFVVIFLIFAGYVLFYVRKITKNPSLSLTYENDETLRANVSNVETGEKNDASVRRIYTVFMFLSVVITVVTAVIESIRDYQVVFLSVYFLIGGIVAGILACHDVKKVLGGLKVGLISSLPAILFVAVASSVKYIFVEGQILPTVVNQINEMTNGVNPVGVAFILYLIILVLEFFISSSTAKAILVISMLAVANVGLSKSMLVLLYTFADGYTNILFPTSPVLLIGLSMINISYFKWVRKSAPLFTATTIAVIAFIIIGIKIGY
ncbi:MAG: hypothetical protein J6O00_01180 [Clostridiales bacterium]|nr:hypothetical protein [Clostridiales bacterium]